MARPDQFTVPPHGAHPVQRQAMHAAVLFHRLEGEADKATAVRTRCPPPWPVEASMRIMREDQNFSRG